MDRSFTETINIILFNKGGKIRSKGRLFLTFISMLFLVQGFNAQAQEARARWEMLNLIRKEKFDIILPQAMRANKIDMWIHVIRDGNPDHLALDLGDRIGGGRTVYFIFTDRGDERIERAILNGERGSDVYDIFGQESDLKQFVTERDPKRIAVNISERLAVADGLSHTGYLKLVDMLGEKYAKRLVSSENVVTDFRVRRVQTEIIAYAKACEIQRRIMETGLKSIKPGVTTREDLGWWAEDQLLARGLESEFGICMPGVLYSEVSDRSETRKPGYIIQRGDLLSWDWGIRYLNFGTDFKRNAYILREGETSVPAGVQNAWDRGMKARKIIRKAFKVGRTAGEVLEIIARSLEDAGYVYTPFTNIRPKDREIINSLGDSERSGFSIDCHCVGNTGNGNVASGPSVAPFRKERAHLKIQPNNLFAFEFMVHTWVPEWGRRLSINFEDDAIVTGKGVEFLCPPNERIILIR